MCGSGSVVERCLAKANVASSSLVFRSNEKTALLILVVLFLCNERHLPYFRVHENALHFWEKGASKR